MGTGLNGLCEDGVEFGATLRVVAAEEVTPGHVLAFAGQLAHHPVNVVGGRLRQLLQQPELILAHYLHHVYGLLHCFRVDTLGVGAAPAAMWKQSANRSAVTGHSGR